MEKITFKPSKNGLQGEITIPGDKSISHRSIMLGSLAEGKTEVKNFLTGEDCLRTINIFRQFGVTINLEGTDVTIKSPGVKSFKEPTEPLYFGNSGTTARLMFGILPALPFHTVVHGDPHLTIRPMGRVVNPLKLMGASIDGRENGEFLPIAIRGKELKGIHYEMPVKSAQVKSAILLAGLFATGKTTVIEETKTRDHTENMLAAFGANITVNKNEISITNQNLLTSTNVTVPGDISSAAFLLVAGAIVPNSELTLKNVGLNETRSGIIDVLQEMNAQISLSNERISAGEKIGDVSISYSPLKAIVIDGNMIPRLIDEIPIIALLATQAKGTTVIKDAEELRVKETDRIKAVVKNLTTLGANIEETEDGMIIHGNTPLKGGELLSFSDHRMAMMAVISSFVCTEKVWLDDTSSIAISYPEFFDDVRTLLK